MRLIYFNFALGWYETARVILADDYNYTQVRVDCELPASSVFLEQRLKSLPLPGPSWCINRRVCAAAAASPSRTRISVALYTSSCVLLFLNSKQYHSARKLFQSTAFKARLCDFIGL